MRDWWDWERGKGNQSSIWGRGVRGISMEEGVSRGVSHGDTTIRGIESSPVCTSYLNGINEKDQRSKITHWSSTAKAANRAMRSNEQTTGAISIVCSHPIEKTFNLDAYYCLSRSLNKAQFWNVMKLYKPTGGEHGGEIRNCFSSGGGWRWGEEFDRITRWKRK